jgi:Flp pilus assembly pilin Flp
VNRRVQRGGESGQGLAEYAFILALVTLTVVTMLVATGGVVRSLYSNIATATHQAGL